MDWEPPDDTEVLPLPPNLSTLDKPISIRVSFGSFKKSLHTFNIPWELSNYSIGIVHKTL